MGGSCKKGQVSFPARGCAGGEMERMWRMAIDEMGSRRLGGRGEFFGVRRRIYFMVVLLLVGSGAGLQVFAQVHGAPTQPSPPGMPSTSPPSAPGRSSINPPNAPGMPTTPPPSAPGMPSTNLPSAPGMPSSGSTNASGLPTGPQ